MKEGGGIKNGEDEKVGVREVRQRKRNQNSWRWVKYVGGRCAKPTTKLSGVRTCAKLLILQEAKESSSTINEGGTEQNNGRLDFTVD